MQQEFQVMMKSLFKYMDIILPDNAGNDVYSVTVDEKVTMRFFSAPEGYLNVIAQIAQLPKEIKSSVLINLLQLNCFTPVHPEFQFKVGVEKTTGTIELWMKQPLSGLSQEKLIELFDFFVQASELVMAQLAPTSPGASTQHQHSHRSKFQFRK